MRNGIMARRKLARVPKGVGPGGKTVYGSGRESWGGPAEGIVYERLTNELTGERFDDPENAQKIIVTGRRGQGGKAAYVTEADRQELLEMAKVSVEKGKVPRIEKKFLDRLRQRRSVKKES